MLRSYLEAFLMRLSLPQLVLALGSLVVMCALILIMVRRKLRASYPLFFGYVIINALAVVICLATYRYAFEKYFYVYWTTSTILMIVGFTVQYEVFVDILKPFSAVIDLGKMLFFWAAGFLFLAGILTASVTSGSHASKIVVAVDLCDRCVHMMQVGLLLLLVVFEKRLSLSWRSPGMGVALGLGAIAAMDLVVSYSQGRFPGLYGQLEMTNGIVFTSVLCFWAFRLSSKESAPITAATSPSRLIIQRWNDALISYRHGDLAFASSTMNSFLPGVEQTVDRVLARKMIQ
jgi:hypothetical protein